MATNALRNWNFEVPEINRLIAPIQQGYQDYRKQEQLQVENQRADEQLGMQRTKLGMERERFDRDSQNAEIARIGNMAKVIDGEKDPTRRAAMLRRMYQGSPNMVTALTKSGVDPNDHVNVPKFLMAQAGGYDPLAEQKARAEIGRIGASTRLAGAQADYYKARATPAPVAAPPQADPLAGHGLDDNGNIVGPGVSSSPQPIPGSGFADLPGPSQQQFMPIGPGVVAPVGQQPGRFSPPMRLGGPTDDIERTTLPDTGGQRWRSVGGGVQVAQAGGGQPRSDATTSPIAQARERSFGPAGMTSPQVQGVVTDAGRNRRVDVPATREMQGQRAFDAATPEQQQRLLKMRQEQAFWGQTYGRPARAGYYYGPDGREMLLTDKNFKGDRETQAVALMNMNKIEDASKKLLSYDYLSRTVGGALNIGEIGQAFSDMKQGAMGLAYALSGKTVAVAEMKNFMEAYGPAPGDGEQRIKLKTQRMRDFYQALLTASRGGESYETAFARAMASTGLTNPDGTPAGQPAAASAGQPKVDPAQQRLKSKYGLE